MAGVQRGRGALSDMEEGAHYVLRGTRTPGGSNSKSKGPGQEGTWCAGTGDQRAGQCGLICDKQRDTGSKGPWRIGQGPEHGGLHFTRLFLLLLLWNWINADEDTEQLVSQSLGIPMPVYSRPF